MSNLVFGFSIASLHPQHITRIEAEFVVDIDENQQEHHQAERKAEEVDQRVGDVAPKATKGDDEPVAKHIESLRSCC